MGSGEPSHPKYSVMVADIIKNCENKRTGISRAGILKALLELDFQLAGEENEKKNRVNNTMKRAIKKGVETGKFKMAAAEGRKGSGHYKIADPKKAPADGEVAKPTAPKKTAVEKSKNKS